MFQRFFTPHPRTGRYPYEALDAFLGTWRGLWWGAVSRLNPFNSLRRFATADKHHTADQPDAEYVAWEYEGQPAKLYVDGHEVLKEFHGKNLSIRRDGTIRMLEKRFTIPDWHGFTLRGVIDRIDITPEGAIIIDYKNGRRDQPELETGIQLTIYQLAYQFLRSRHRIPGSPPLRGLYFYNYRRGELQEAPLRQPHEFGMLLVYLTQLKAYWEGVLLGKQYPPGIVNGPVNVNPNDVLTGDVTPFLPRGAHCRYCRCFRQCREWEQGLRPNARQAFTELHQLYRLQRTPTQTTMPFAEHPVVVQVAKSYADLVAHVPSEQLSLEV